MTTISVPITKEQEHFIKARVKSGVSASVAHAVRQAVDALAHRELMENLMEAEKQYLQGKTVKGSVRKILK